MARQAKSERWAYGNPRPPSRRVSSGIDLQKEGELLTREEAEKRYEELLAASNAERAARKGVNLTTLQAWCPEPKDGCALPVKEAYDFYEKARESYAPGFRNKLTSKSFQNMLSDDIAFAIHLAKAPILILHPEKDVVPIENVLFYYKRAPEPKKLIVIFRAAYNDLFRREAFARSSR
jgi:hypothetical protein